MAGPIAIKLKETITYEELIKRVQKGWDSQKYGEPKMLETNGKKYLGFAGTEWISAIAYPERKKVVLQAMPGSYQVVFTKEGKSQLRKVNKEILPQLAEGLRTLLTDVIK